MAGRTIIDEIEEARDQLGFSSTSIQLLESPLGEVVYRSVLDRFVTSANRRWWWEDFRKPCQSRKFEDGDGWRHIAKLVPDSNELVWLIAEDNSLPHYPVFETTPNVASHIIGGCYGFEYYIVAKDLSWLLCETHHNTMCAIGSVVEAKLQNMG